MVAFTIKYCIVCTYCTRLHTQRQQICSSRVPNSSIRWCLSCHELTVRFTVWLIPVKHEVACLLVACLYLSGHKVRWALSRLNTERGERTGCLSVSLTWTHTYRSCLTGTSGCRSELRARPVLRLLVLPVFSHRNTQIWSLVLTEHTGCLSGLSWTRNCLYCPCWTWGCPNRLT